MVTPIIGAWDILSIKGGLEEKFLAEIT